MNEEMVGETKAILVGWQANVFTSSYSSMRVHLAGWRRISIALLSSSFILP
jgi:hypothetical protein